MNDISNFGFVIEAILKVLSWLADILVGEHKSSAEKEDHRAAGVAASKTEPDRSESVEFPVAAPDVGSGAYAVSASPESTSEGTAGNDRWAAYFGKQEALSQTAANVVPAAKPQRARWIKDFGPGALGAFLVTLGLLAYIYFSDAEFASEATQLLLISVLVSLPVSLAVGGLFGAVGSLLMKQIAHALYLGDRAQGVAITVASMISGAVTGLLCGGLSLIAGAF